MVKWRGHHCEHHTHPIIRDWLNLSLLEAAVFITVIVLLCCFAAEECLGGSGPRCMCLHSSVISAALTHRIYFSLPKIGVWSSATGEGSALGAGGGVLPLLPSQCSVSFPVVKPFPVAECRNLFARVKNEQNQPSAKLKGVQRKEFSIFLHSFHPECKLYPCIPIPVLLPTCFLAAAFMFELKLDSQLLLQL